MIVAIHQPNYAPYLGFFHKMWLADTFILYDTAQFSKNDFQNRSRVKTPRGPFWLSVPVLRGSASEIRSKKIDTSKEWGARHWRTIQTNYSRAPHFESYQGDLDALYRRPWEFLAPLNEAFISFLAMSLGLHARWLRASALDLPGGLSPSAKLAELVRRAGGDTYLSGVGGLEYLDPTAFRGMDLLVQDFRHPEYTQCWGPFVPNLSALDLLLNIGGDAKDLVQSAGGVRPWPR